MTRTTIARLLVAVPLGACAASPGAVVPPPALVYEPPGSAPLVYVQADTATLDLAAGGQSFVVRTGSAATWSMALEPTPDGLRVTATLTDLDARLDNPVAGPRRADQGGVTGPVVFDLGPRGEADLVAAPRLEGTARELFSAATVVYHLFPRLPGRAVAPGERWSDTVRYEIDDRSGEVAATTALTYTALGDSMVAGTPHLLVRYEGTDRRRATGESAGMAFSQDVAGTVEGSFLWDRSRTVLRSLEQRSDLRGTMNVDVAPGPLDVRVRGSMRVELQQVPPPPG